MDPFDLSLTSSNCLSIECGVDVAVDGHWWLNSYTVRVTQVVTSIISFIIWGLRGNQFYHQCGVFYWPPIKHMKTTWKWCQSAADDHLANQRICLYKGFETHSMSLMLWANRFHPVFCVCLFLLCEPLVSLDQFFKISLLSNNFKWSTVYLPKPKHKPPCWNQSLTALRDGV